MYKIKRFRNNLLIEIGGIYNFEGKEYEVVTAVSEVVGSHADTVAMSELVYWLKEVTNGEIKQVPENILQKELPKYNLVH